ncbi:MAG: YceI family protein [Candidatus Eremiobacteraeota bacterium]|nr:YceI family protein [Candidatus Eremiobacteraeota bacterium]
MRRLIGTFALAAMTVAVTVRVASADDALVHPLDLAKSHASFTVSHVYVTRVTGHVPIAAGSVELTPGSTLPKTVTATLDARHVDTGNGDRDDDLQGPDWLDTKKFPTWSFVSSGVKPGANDGFELDGTLTVHGVPQPVALTVTVTRGLPHPAYHAVGHLDRHAFGMRTTPQDGLIGSDVTLTLDVELR